MVEPEAKRIEGFCERAGDSEVRIRVAFPIRHAKVKSSSSGCFCIVMELLTQISAILHND
jgi:hypothetical protein